MTPQLAEFVNRITALESLPAKDELRALAPEVLYDVTWILCSEVRAQAERISNATKVLTD